MCDNHGMEVEKINRICLPQGAFSIDEIGYGEDIMPYRIEIGVDSENANNHIIAASPLLGVDPGNDTVVSTPDARSTIGLPKINAN